MASRSALIACANSKLQEWVYSILRSSGFTNIVCVRDEHELSTKLSESYFSFILIDDDQQNINSVRIITRFRKTAGRPQSIFIVMIDGSNREVIDAVKYQGLSLAGVIIKPFEAQALQKIVAKLLKVPSDNAPARPTPLPEAKEVLISAKLFTAKVIDCDVFVGVSFKGTLSYGDASMIKRAFYKAYSIDKPVMIAINISDVIVFDEGFAGLLLQYNGMVSSRGR